MNIAILLAIDMNNDPISFTPVKACVAAAIASNAIPAIKKVGTSSLVMLPIPNTEVRPIITPRAARNNAI